MQIPEHLLPMIGPIVAAMIAGAIAFLVTVLTKEGKVSEFRQTWIDALRNDIADLIGVLKYLSGALEASVKSAESDHDWLNSQKQELLKAEVLATRILLRLNATEHRTFIGLLRPILESQALDTDINPTTIRPLLGEAQALLKREWTRVKRGETVYQITKWASLALLAIAALYLAKIFIS